MEEETLIKKFYFLFEEKKYKDSLVLIDQIIKIHPFSAEYYSYKGSCLYYLKRFKEAIECYNMAIRWNNKNPVYYINKATALVELGEFEEAHSVLEVSLIVDDKNSLAYYEKGRAFFGQLKFYKSLECINKCLTFDSKKLYAHYYKGILLRELNCLEESIEEFDLEIQINPDYSSSFHQKALTLMKIEKYDEALIELDKAINKNLNEKEFYDDKVACLIKLNKFEEALIVVEKILINYPSDCKAIKNKAEIYLKIGKPDEALKLINVAIMKSQTKQEYHEIKGLILYKLKKDDEAIDLLMRAIDTKEKPKQEILEIMSLIINNYKSKNSCSQVFSFEKDVDECLKFLEEIQNREPILLQVPSFSPKRLRIDWEKIYIDKANIINYVPCYEDYFCKVCLSLSKRPKSCYKCDDLICTDCLDKMKNNKRNSCPNCRKTPFEESSLNKLVKNTYNNIEIFCPLECGEKIIMEKLEKHLAVCEKAHVNLECNLCLLTLVNENEKENHKKHCREAKMKCPFCSKEFLRKYIDNHMKVCNEKLIKCTKCSCKVPLKYEASHKTFFCDLLLAVRNKLVCMQNKLLDFIIID